MISHKKKIVFVHIPKTGGKCLSEFLFPYCDEESLRFSPFGEISDLHATAAQYVEHYGLEQLDGYRFFTIVRNPFDKALSLALHQNKNVFEREHFRQVIQSPKEFNLWPHSHAHFLLNKWLWPPELCKMFAKGAEVPVDQIILDKYPHQPLRAQFNNMKKMLCPATILRFENYAQDVSAFFDMCDIKYDMDKLTVKTNTTDHQHYSQYYEEEEIAEIKYACGFDLQWLGYKFEKGEQK